MSDINTRLWELVEAAIENEQAMSWTSTRRLAKAATVALLRGLSAEVAAAEEDDVEWPDSGDLTILADELEARNVGGAS